MTPYKPKPLSGRQPNTATLNFALSKKIKEEIQQTAKDLGLSTSDFLRQLFKVYQEAKNESAKNH